MFPLSFAVTVWAPAVVTVHTLPAHDPSGETENVVDGVTSNEVPLESKPCAVNV